MVKNATQETKTTRAPRKGSAGYVAQPRSIPVLVDEPEMDVTPDQPFAEGAYDAIDPDLRHRMISEVAYRRYVERGYDDGFDQDDWLQAEADIDHLLLNRSGIRADDA